ncbi:hypothetical protein EK904_008252 [Melospiza melodia maxima]|nr:hypothetical protein EK904_008252 [Melospiza melodia maxima]
MWRLSSVLLVTNHLSSCYTKCGTKYLAATLLCVNEELTIVGGPSVPVLFHAVRQLVLLDGFTGIEKGGLTQVKM